MHCGRLKTRHLREVRPLLIALVGAVGAGTSGCRDGVAPRQSDRPSVLRVVGGDTQIASPGAAFLEPLVVQALRVDPLVHPAVDPDPCDVTPCLPVAGVPVEFAVTAGSATVTPSLAMTDAHGMAMAVVVPTGPGTLRITARVRSPALAASFRLSAGGGPSAATCESAGTLPPVARVVGPLGGNRVCLAAGDSASDYVVIPFHRPTGSSATATIRVAATGSPAPAAKVSRDPVVLPSTETRAANRHTGHHPAIRAAHQRFSHIAGIRTAAATHRTPFSPADTIGHLRALNANLHGSCDDPAPRTGRVAAVSQHAVVIADTSSPAGGFTDLELHAIATRFDSIWHPLISGNFQQPSDVDGNARVILFFTRAVNELAEPGSIPESETAAVFLVRDLLPRESPTSSGQACPAGNFAEVLYVAVPDPGGGSGPPWTKAHISAVLGRAIVHQYQHLINAGRRLHVTFAPRLEAPWLDEAMSHVAEEMLFQRLASRVSRENLGPVDLGRAPEAAQAFRAAQLSNLRRYEQFLANVDAASPLWSAASATGLGQGGAWSFVRYLADRRAGVDWELFAEYGRSRDTGLVALQRLFAFDVRDAMRDWSISLLADDLFATESRYQQSSWNWPALFSALVTDPFPLRTSPLSGGAPRDIVLAPGASAFLIVRVPAGSTAEVTWSGTNQAAVPPQIEWSLIRLR